MIKHYGSEKSISIEITSACNCKCVWCQMQRLNKIKKGFMSYIQFKGIIEGNKNYFLENNIGVEPYFRGEPLLHPDFFNIMDCLKNNGIRNVGINTNLSVHIDVKKFKDYTMPILVNLGGITKDTHEQNMMGSNFDLVTNNLKEMFNYKIPVSVKMNPTKWNVHQMKGLNAFIKSLGGSEKNVMQYTTGFPNHAIASDEEINDFFHNVVSQEVSPHLRFKYDTSKPRNNIRTKVPGCRHLQNVIFFDGQYSICCHDQFQQINLGNAFKESIQAIRDSKEYGSAIVLANKCGYAFCKECN